MADTLQSLIASMQEMVADGWEHEHSHIVADALLTRALQLLATDETRTDVDTLIAAFDSLNKWYS